MRLTLLGALLALTAAGQSAENGLRQAALANTRAAVEPMRGPVNRVNLSYLEKQFDKQIERLRTEEPFYLLGNTRGVYINGYGILFSSEVNLVVTAALSPFSRREYTKEDIARVKSKKGARLPELRQGLREMMFDAAAALDNVPPDERVVMAVNLFYWHWEDSQGLPGQVVMQATRRALLATRKDRVALETVIETREY